MPKLTEKLTLSLADFAATYSLSKENAVEIIKKAEFLSFNESEGEISYNENSCDCVFVCEAVSIENETLEKIKNLSDVKFDRFYKQPRSLKWVFVPSQGSGELFKKHLTEMKIKYSQLTREGLINSLSYAKDAFNLKGTSDASDEKTRSWKKYSGAEFKNSYKLSSAKSSLCNSGHKQSCYYASNNKLMDNYGFPYQYNYAFNYPYMYNLSYLNKPTNILMLRQNMIMMNNIIASNFIRQRFYSEVFPNVEDATSKVEIDESKVSYPLKITHKYSMNQVKDIFSYLQSNKVLDKKPKFEHDSPFISDTNKTPLFDVLTEIDKVNLGFLRGENDSVLRQRKKNKENNKEKDNKNEGNKDNKEKDNK